MRLVLGMALLIGAAGCGGGGLGGSDSYTAKAFDEFRAGSGADHFEKRKSPTKTEIAAVKKRIKSHPAGSRADLLQGLRILSNQREHEELHFNTIAKSTYVSDAYRRAFGTPESANTRDEPNSWSHTCTDGKVSLRGILKVKDQPNLMTMFPPKPK